MSTTDLADFLLQNPNVPNGITTDSSIFREKYETFLGKQQVHLMKERQVPLFLSSVLLGALLTLPYSKKRMPSGIDKIYYKLSDNNVNIKIMVSFNKYKDFKFYLINLKSGLSSGKFIEEDMIDLYEQVIYDAYDLIAAEGTAKKPLTPKKAKLENLDPNIKEKNSRRVSDSVLPNFKNFKDQVIYYVTKKYPYLKKETFMSIGNQYTEVTFNYAAEKPIAAESVGLAEKSTPFKVEIKTIEISSAKRTIVEPPFFRIELNMNNEIEANMKAFVECRQNAYSLAEYAEDVFKSLTTIFQFKCERYGFPKTKEALMGFVLGAIAFNFQDKYSLDIQLVLKNYLPNSIAMMLKDHSGSWISQKVPVLFEAVNEPSWEKYLTKSEIPFLDEDIHLPNNFATESNDGVLVRVDEKYLAERTFNKFEGKYLEDKFIFTISPALKSILLDKQFAVISKPRPIQKSAPVCIIDEIINLKESNLHDPSEIEVKVKHLEEKIREIHSVINSKRNHHFLSSFILGKLLGKERYMDKHSEIAKHIFFYHDAYTPDDLYAFTFKLKHDDVGFLINVAENNQVEREIPFEIYGKNIPIPEIPIPPVNLLGMKSLIRIDIVVNQENQHDLFNTDLQKYKIQDLQISRIENVENIQDTADGRFFDVKPFDVEELLHSLYTRPEEYKEANQITIFDYDPYDDNSLIEDPLELIAEQNRLNEHRDALRRETHFENHILNQLSFLQKNVRHVTDLQAFIKGILHGKVNFFEPYNLEDPVLAIYPFSGSKVHFLALNHVSLPSVDDQMDSLEAVHKRLFERYIEDYKRSVNKRKATLSSLTYNTCAEPDFDSVDNIFCLKEDTEGVSRENFESCLNQLRRKRHVNTCFIFLKDKMKKLLKKFYNKNKYLPLENEIVKTPQKKIKVRTPYQTTVHHFQKVQFYANGLTHFILAKDIISGLVNGDYKQVAFNTGFLAGSMGFGKLALKMEKTGLQMAKSGRLFFGKMLRSSAPFLSRATCGFVIYDLVSQIKAYQNNDTDALVDIIGDAIWITADLIDIGIVVAEAFGLISGVSAIGGPVTAIIGAAVLIGLNIYHAVKAVERIDEAVHLDKWERLKQGWRAFFHIQPDQYLLDLMQEQEFESHVVSKEYEMLKKLPTIKNYFFPYLKKSGSTIEEVKDNKLDLTKQVFRVSRIWPKETEEMKLICANTHEGYGTWKYLLESKDMFGISDNTKKNVSVNLIKLGDGIDHATGSNNETNIFILGDGRKKIIGGKMDDVFILTGNSTSAEIHGNHGHNTLKLESFSTASSKLFIFLYEKVGSLRTSGSYNLRNRFWFWNITAVIGRKEKVEIISMNTCSVTRLDTQGGKDIRSLDAIKIEEINCTNSINLIIGGFTKVHNNAKRGQFIYLINKIPGPVMVHMKLGSNISNTFSIETSLGDITKLKLNQVMDGYHTLSIESRKTSINVTIFNASTNKTRYFLNDGSEIRVQNNKAVIMQVSNEPAKKLALEYAHIADRLGVLITVYVNSTGENILIGHGRVKDNGNGTNSGNKSALNVNMLPTNPMAVNHLVGGHTENIFQISLPPMNPNATIDKPLSIPDTILYHFDTSNFKNTLDLSQIYRYHQQKSIKVWPEIYNLTEQGVTNMVLKLNAEHDKNTTTVGRVILYNAFEDYKFENLNVHLKVPMQFVTVDDKLLLEPAPLIFHKDIKIILITIEDIEIDNDLIIERNETKFKFFKNESDLFMTNAVFNEIHESQILTIVFKEFFLHMETMLTLTIEFSETLFSLMYYYDEIEETTKFGHNLKDWERFYKLMNGDL